MGLPELAPAGQDEVVELAAQEGHDADIPTNLGVISHRLDTDDPAEKDGRSDKELDLEKAELCSGSSSVTEQAEDLPEATDPNVVSWDGPDDPENPMNWSKAKKWGGMAVVSIVTFLTPLGSSIFAPGVPELMKEFHSNDDMLAGFVVSVYVLGFTFGPLVIAPMSEMYGRLPLYHSCNILFIIFNVGCALSKTMAMLIGFRFLAGTVGSAPLTLGGGTIADTMAREDRGTAMALWVVGPTLGPVVGPIAGGFISGTVGWRWNFWVVAIAAGIVTVAGTILMRETYGPTILTRKTERLRKETGNMELKSALDSGLTPKDLFLYSIVRPTKMLMFSPIVQALSVYVAVSYAYLYILFTTFTFAFETEYGISNEVVGLTFIGLGVGQFIGQFVNTYFGNKHVNKHLARGDFKPEHRLPMMYLGAFTMPIGLFWYGWSVQAHTHWVVPILGTGIFGFALLLIFMPANTYLVDAFTIHAASAMAANTVLRSLVATVLPLAGQKMYAKLGYGWGNSLLAFVAIALLPIPFLFVRYGERIRTKYTVKL